MAAPNQRIIYIERESEKVRTDFFKIGHSQLNRAASDLEANAFKLYIYLADNSNNYKLELSSKHFIEWSGTSDSTYKRAFNELVEKGYLIKAPEHKNIYLFREISSNYDERHQEDKIVLSDKETIEELFYKSK